MAKDARDILTIMMTQRTISVHSVQQSCLQEHVTLRIFV